MEFKKIFFYSFFTIFFISKISIVDNGFLKSLLVIEYSFEAVSLFCLLILADSTFSKRFFKISMQTRQTLAQLTQVRSHTSQLRWRSFVILLTLTFGENFNLISFEVNAHNTIMTPVYLYELFFLRLHNIQNFVYCGPQNQSRFNAFYILQLCIDNEVQPLVYRILNLTRFTCLQHYSSEPFDLRHQCNPLNVERMTKIQHILYEFKSGGNGGTIENE
ncbi:hypothetical protein AGLY_009999 [Aphis glycines]|uniref:Uncharacterized protein n=1 Tax=Aphis glycines TaxID=307491 RepID=A0A6G0TH09_APHGL|nr:hypothetical protein AGLY_009999 [Aphis glycines]